VENLEYSLFGAWTKVGWPKQQRHNVSLWSFSFGHFKPTLLWQMWPTTWYNTASNH